MTHNGKGIVGYVAVWSGIFTDGPLTLSIMLYSNELMMKIKAKWEIKPIKYQY